MIKVDMEGIMENSIVDNMAIVDSGQQRYIYYARKIDQDGTEFIPIASNLRLLPLDLIGPNCPE